MKVDFFIVGAPKAGTTSLYHYLDEHHDICMSSDKEPNYFSDEELQQQDMYYGKSRVETLDIYHSLFDKHSESKIKGEASVSYLFYKKVPKKIKEYNPNAKIIIMLRNPSHRAFSHYLMDRRLGLVYDSFDDVIDKKSNHKNASLFYQQYIQVGQYASQVKRYLECFDRENILFIDYEEFREDITHVMNRVYQFLNVELENQVDLNQKHNTYSRPKNNIIRFIYSFVFLRNILTSFLPKKLIKAIRSVLFKRDKKPSLSEETKEKLKAIFTDDVNELSKILNKDFSSWIK